MVMNGNVITLLLSYNNKWEFSKVVSFERWGTGLFCCFSSLTINDKFEKSVLLEDKAGTAKVWGTSELEYVLVALKIWLSAKWVTDVSFDWRVFHWQPFPQSLLIPLISTFHC